MERDREVIAVLKRNTGTAIAHPLVLLKML
jgi:hypothetical protein